MKEKFSKKDYGFYACENEADFEKAVSESVSSLNLFKDGKIVKVNYSVIHDKDSHFVSIIVSKS